MPDPEFKTISSSQVPDLLQLSPWGSRYTLFHQFRQRAYEERTQTVRMKIGKLFESLTLELTAEKLTLEVHPNRGPDGEPVYLRHASLPLGCTEDAAVFCPTRGHGTVEAKAVDAYEWKRNWTKAKAPQMYEAQLQAQMLVKGDTWGVIACLVYNEGTDGVLRLYERRPHHDSQSRIAAAAVEFFADLESGNEPSPFGIPIEIDVVSELYPEADPKKIIEDPDNFDIAEKARLYAWTVEQKTGFERAEKSMRPQILGYMKDAAMAAVAGGVRIKVNKPQIAGQVVMLPAELRKKMKRCIDEYLWQHPDINYSLFDEVLHEAIDWCHIAKRPSIQNRISIVEGEEEIAPTERPSILEAG